MRPGLLWLCVAFIAVGYLALPNLARDLERYEDDVNGDCKEAGFQYAMTECDREMGRWRVQIPRSARCADTEPRAARRIDQCHISCDAGYFYDLEELACRICRPGTYSLGGGVLLENFRDSDGLPEGFTAQIETFRPVFTKRSRSQDVNCSEFGWSIRGGLLASMGGPCAATLTYTVQLVKPGNLTYTYQYPDKDVIFAFEVQNAQCQSIRDSKEFRWPQCTNEGEWKRQTVHLLTGQNVLQWKTLGMDHGQSRPVLIKSIEIGGVSLTSSCMPCPPGTYSAGGARSCVECPENTFSNREAASCTPCDAVKEFAPRGSSTCFERQPCTWRDFYQTRTPCDENKETRLVYKWSEPKICRDDLAEAEQLPPMAPRRPCEPCNPGMAYGNGTRCRPCPRDTWSDGSGVCKACPPSTTPNYGVYLSRWFDMPPFMRTACMAEDGSPCPNMVGWTPGVNYISSGMHHGSGYYVLLSLSISGFRSKGGISGGRRLEVGKVVFDFELQCDHNCEFVFLQGVTVIESWMTPVQRMTYVYPVMQNDSYTFSWAFQRLSDSSGGRPSGHLTDNNRFPVDEAKLYVVNVTNTLEGGADSCLPCHQESEDQGCIPCPPGQYVDPNTTRCVYCPDDTTAPEPLAAARLGEDACQPCGPGMHAHQGGQCSTNCVFQVNDQTYDFRAIDGPIAVRGSRLFTASGAQYYHLFNLSLCGGQLAECTNTDLGEAGPGVGFGSQQVRSYVCRTTVIPGQMGLPDEDQTYSQSVTLGDELVAVTTDISFMHMRVIDEFVKPEYNDIHFYYATPLPTRSCPQGRTTVITLRCDPHETGNNIKLPSQWPDGTSDGCDFNFLWTSRAACRMCNPSDFKVVKGECVGKVQAVHYLPAKNCFKDSLPPTEHVPCTTHIPVELQLVVATSVALALLLAGCMVYFWKKTQRLEYKYMKVMQSSGTQGEGDPDAVMAPAESCALGEGEEEDVAFNQPGALGSTARGLGRRLGLLNRIKAMRNKTESGKSFETVQLTK